MRTTAKMFIVSLMGLLTLSALPAFAAKTFESKVVRQLGDNMYLIRAGGGDGAKGFCQNDVIPVYREVAHGWPIKGMQQIKTVNEVGDVRILSHVSGRDFNAQLVDGSVQVGDTAKKVGVYCADASIR